MSPPPPTSSGKKENPVKASPAGSDGLSTGDVAPLTGAAVLAGVATLTGAAMLTGLAGGLATVAKTVPDRSRRLGEVVPLTVTVMQAGDPLGAVSFDTGTKF
jgi:hypothetical protein